MKDFEEPNKKQSEREKKKRAGQLYDLKKVLDTPHGRRFVWRVLDLAGIWRISFNTNALNMSFNEGQRNLGLTIFEDVMIESPGSFTQMQKEAVSDLKTEESELKKIKAEENDDD